MTLKIAVLAPMARAIVAMQTAREARALRAQEPGRIAEVLRERGEHGRSPRKRSRRRADGRRRRGCGGALRCSRQANRASATSSRAVTATTPRAPAAPRCVAATCSCEDRCHLGAEPHAGGRRQQAERGAMEAHGQRAHGHAFRGVRRFCRAIFTARSRRAASSRATSRPSRADAVVARRGSSSPAPRPALELLDQPGVEQPLDGGVERARREADFARPSGARMSWMIA